MGLLRKLWGQRTPAQPVLTPLSVLDELHAGRTRDYCLYVPPGHSSENRAKVQAAGIFSIDIERMIIEAFVPLTVLRLEEPDTLGHGTLPEESFLTLAEHARLLWLAPTNDARFLNRLRLLKDKGPLNRCIFLMPETGTLGTIDWPRTWDTTHSAAATLGIELSPYTPGGWLFRLAPDGKACTFRPIVNPNVEKIAKALEDICEQMT